MYFNAPAGDLNKRVFIAKGYQQKGNAGSTKIVYSAASGFSGTEGGSAASGFSATWAGIEILTGRELQVAQAIVPQVDSRITLRNKSELTNLDKIVFGSRSFFILAIINPNEGNRFTQLLCREDRS